MHNFQCSQRLTVEIRMIIRIPFLGTFEFGLKFRNTVGSKRLNALNLVSWSLQAYSGQVP